MGMSAIAIEFKKRRDFLLRACRHDRDLRATPVGDTYEVRWTDFAAWLDRQRGKGPWDLLPDEFEQRLKKFGADEHAEKEEATAPAVATEAGGTAFAPASATTAADGAVEPQEGHSSSLGIKGKAAALNWLSALMSEFPKSPPPEFVTKPDLEEYVRKTFEITQLEFREVFRSAKEISRAKWYRRGHKSKN